MWGRGGAGNIQQAAEASKQRGAEDLEAGKPPTADSDPNTTNSTPSNTTVPQEYAHMGRGGAGNYYSPASLASTGTFEQPGSTGSSTAEPALAALENLDSSSGWWNTATTTTTTTTTTSANGNNSRSSGEQQQQQQKQVETPLARTGRGGAGNFVWGGGSERRAEQVRREWGELRERQRDVESKVAESVERAVPPPGKAWLGGGKETLQREN